MLKVERWIADILSERQHMLPCLAELPIVKQVYPSSANFILVKVTDANTIYNYLIDKGIVTRNRDQVKLCENCLRITIGTRDENSELLGALRSFR